MSECSDKSDGCLIIILFVVAWWWASRQIDRLCDHLSMLQNQVVEQKDKP